MAKKKAANQPGVWGIDLGLCALKAIRLEKQGDKIVATAFDYIEHPKILSQPDADPDQLTREALEEFLSRNKLKGDMVSIGVPGQSGLARFVKLPPVDQRKITDIVKFEAKQQIPFPLHEVVWGYQRLGASTMSDNMIIDAEVGLFAMKRDMINRCMQHFKDVGVEVHFIQMAPLALCNFLAHDLLNKGPAGDKSDEEDAKGGKTCVVGLDIGADNSNLVITDGEKIIWQRPIPLGGNHFTRALTKDLKLTFAKAEHLKRNAVKSPDLKKILGALKPVLNDFVSEVQRSLGYFTNTHRDATVKYMLGLGNAFRLPGLQKYLQEKLQLEVRKLQKIKRLSGEDTVTEAPQYAENVLSFGVAHGLALQGLNETCIHTNLLPPEITQDRAVRAKKPWAVAAAAVLLLLTPPLLLGWSASEQAWSNKGVVDAKKKLENIVTTATREKQEAEQLAKEASDSKDKVASLAGGTTDRLNWLHLHNFISEALPRPDGTRLVEQGRVLGGRPYYNYFVGHADARGKDAYENWQKIKAKLARGEALSDKEQSAEEDVKRSLVQVHIEGVSAVFSSSPLAEYIVKLTRDESKYSFKLNGFNKEEIENARGKKGAPKEAWIIEIHGYTYHQHKEAFVLNSLVENLVDLADPDPKNRRLKDVKLHPASPSALVRKDKKSAVSNILLYDHEISSPSGGFTLITKCFSAEMVGVMGARTTNAPVSTTVIVVKSADGAVAAPPAPPSGRNSWRPPMETAINELFLLNLNRMSSALPSSDAKTAEAARRAVRTEFVVMFLWQEGA